MDPADNSSESTAVKSAHPHSPGGPLGIWYTAVPTEAPVDVRGTVLIYETEQGFVTLGATRGRPVVMVQDYAQAADQAGQGTARFSWTDGRKGKVEFPMQVVDSGMYAGVLAVPDPWEAISHLESQRSVMTVTAAGRPPFVLELPPMDSNRYVDFLGQNNC